MLQFYVSSVFYHSGLRSSENYKYDPPHVIPFIQNEVLSKRCNNPMLNNSVKRRQGRKVKGRGRMARYEETAEKNEVGWGGGVFEVRKGGGGGGVMDRDDQMRF